MGRFQARSIEKFEATPLVVDGMMYLTQAPNDIVALDAVTGANQVGVFVLAFARIAALLRKGESRCGNFRRHSLHGRH